MPKINYPKTIRELTAEWIDYALCEGGIIQKGTVSGIKVQPLGSPVKGFLSSMCRVKIAYNSNDSGLPQSVVIKIPPEVEINRDFATNLKANEREIRFYQELAPKSPVRRPKCYFSYMDIENSDYILVLEDEKNYNPGNQVEGLSREQTISAVEMISGFHGYWWESEELEKILWMPEQNRELIFSYARNWKDFSSEHSDVLSKRDLDAGELISTQGKQIQKLSSCAQKTIAHMDYRADNMLFNELDEIVVVDWQVACKTIGAFDVTRVVCGSFHEYKEHKHHREFVEIWHDGLMQSGVKNYSIDDAWNDYRVGILILSYIPVIAHHLLSHEASRGPDLLKAIIKRVYHAIHECDALELLK